MVAGEEVPPGERAAPPPTVVALAEPVDLDLAVAAWPGISGHAAVAILVVVAVTGQLRLATVVAAAPLLQLMLPI